MTCVVGLDISTHTGIAVFRDVQLESYTSLHRDVEWSIYPYPKNFVHIVDRMAEQILAVLKQIKPDVVVIEETNKTGRFGSRHSQKILEFLHYKVNSLLLDAFPELKVYYVNTSDWRKQLGLSVGLSKKIAKKALVPLMALKKELPLAKTRESKRKIKQQIKDLSADLKKRALLGKIDKKSIAIAFVNSAFDLSLIKKQNDEADAICLAWAYLQGAPTLTNADIFEKKSKTVGTTE